MSGTDTAGPWGTYAPTTLQSAVIGLAHASFLKRGTFRGLLSPLLRAMRPTPIDFEFMGCRFRGRPWRSSADLGMIFNPDYDGTEMRFLKAHTPEGGVFVDVGINLGMYGLVMARHVGPSGKVIGIEPHPEALDYLRFNMAASGIANIHMAEVAVGDHDGEVFIATDPGNLGASRSGATGDVRVPLRKLADIVGEAGVDAVHSLKIDIEGVEDRALMPYFDTMPRALYPRAVVIEHLHHAEWQADVIAHMVGLGYIETARTRTNALLALTPMNG